MRSLNPNITLFCESLTKGTEYKLKGTNAKEKEKKAVEVLIFFFMGYMKWTLEETKDHFTDSIVRTFKLHDVIRYLPYPDDVRTPDKKKVVPDGTLLYILSRVFPEMIKFDKRAAIIELWDDIRSGKESKFVGNFLDGEEGVQRRFILFEEFIRRYVSTDTEGLYKAFSDSAKMNKKMLDVKLSAIISGYYSSPLDMLHEYLTRSESVIENPFLYAVYTYDAIAKIDQMDLLETA